ncbi:MAG: chemotaxis protein CheB [Pseudomonadales bacterium]|nr:chemotaxis protein CheB [Pseudomonadales bacterium]NRA16730.1 chemotaxis protein CheB [Oceanospirillaceae bacterium]
MKNTAIEVKFIAIGVSAGGFEVLNTLVTQLPADFSLPIAIVQHRSADSSGYLAEHLDISAKIKVKDVFDKEPISPGIVYLAPPDYHLLIERGFFFSLSRDDKVNFSRPSIDVLFESAADIYRQACLAIILTGKNHDGAMGLAKIVATGGTAIVQNPGSAQASEMPIAAIKKVPTASVYTLSQITAYLITLNKNQKK